MSKCVESYLYPFIFYLLFYYCYLADGEELIRLEVSCGEVSDELGAQGEQTRQLGLAGPHTAQDVLGGHQLWYLSVMLHNLAENQNV